MTTTQTIGLVMLFLIFILLMGWNISSTWKNRSQFFDTWGRIADYEKRALIVGFILFAALPLLKTHPAKASYIPSVILDLQTVTAGAFFAFGALAFIKIGRTGSPEQEKEPNQMLSSDV